MGTCRRYCDSRFAYVEKAFLPWVGVSGNECVVRNLSLTLGELAKSTAKAIYQPNITAKVVLDNQIVLKFFLFQLQFTFNILLASGVQHCS